MWNLMLMRLYNTTIKSRKVQICKHWTSNVTVIKMNSMCTNTDSFDINLFSPVDKEKILEVINNRNTKDLLQYSISEKRAQNLELHRANNGPFTSLEDLLQVKNMNKKCTYNFYKSIILGKKRIGPKKSMSGLVITPKNIVNDQKDVNTALGIYVGYDMISWSLLNRDCQVLQWSFKCFPQKESKENIHSILQTTIPIARKLPKADRYIMQEASIGHIQNRKSYQHFAQQSLMSAIILSYLTMQDNQCNDIVKFVENNIFILRQSVLRKVYGLTLDKETISTQYMLQKLLQESELVKTNEPKVLIGRELKDMYNAQNSVYQEQIGWSLLISLVFIELFVHKRSDMIFREFPQRS
ncbi:transcription elongation factor, mitochondrial-like isoform X1 [Pogonomyrmex barbatus]|uniref:Transcription elongation factor, mitochondrial-like isoform X1 n=1 Tax=Pogonomyrmex barbatus TaxID=144034 RepID=A0A6I9VP45_9HYME|nr:transcription elongation factor, mitochondrial-like isoform X1 [Pogonomyrmex barbatus]